MSTHDLVRNLARASVKKGYLFPQAGAGRMRRASEKGSDSPDLSVHADLERVEKRLAQVVHLEKTLIAQHKEVRRLQDEIHELKAAMPEQNNGALQKRLDRVLFLLGDLTAHVDSYVKVKSQGETRRQEIETKIKKSIHGETRQLAALESAIADLEKKYAQMKRQKHPDERRLALVEARLRRLRRMIERKKIMPSDGLVLPDVPAKRADVDIVRGFTSKPIPPPRFVYPQEPVQLPHISGKIQQVPSPPPLPSMPSRESFQSRLAADLRSDKMSDNLKGPSQPDMLALLESDIPPPPAPRRKRFRLFGR